MKKSLSILASPVTNLKLLYLLSFAGGTAWIPFFNLYLKNKGMAGGQLGLVSSLIWFMMLIFLPIWGVIADRFGRTVCYKISIITTTLLLLLFGFVGSSIPIIVFCTISCSLFYIALLPMLDTLALDYVENNAKFNYGQLRFWGAIGAGIGAQTTGWIVSMFTTDYIFFTSAFFLGCSIPLVFRLRDKEIKTNGIALEFKDVDVIFKNKLLVIFLIVITVISIGQSCLWNYLTVYYKDIGASDQIASTAVMLDGICELPFYFLAALSFRYIGLRNTLIIAFTGTVIRLYCYSVISTPGLALLVETTNGICWTLLWVGSVEYVNRMVKTEWRATGQSLLWAAYFGAGQIIGNNWVGQLYERMSMPKVFALNSFLILITTMITIVVFWIWKDNNTSDNQIRNESK